LHINLLPSPPGKVSFPAAVSDSVSFISFLREYYDINQNQNHHHQSVIRNKHKYQSKMRRQSSTVLIIISITAHFLLLQLSLVNAQRAASVLSLGTKLERKGKKKKSSFFATASELNIAQDSNNLNDEEESNSDTEIVLEEEEQVVNYQEDPLLHSCEVGFEAIRITLKQKGNKPDRVILDGSIKGKAGPGRMLAVMGPSGSGKSSFVHALAGRIAESSKISVQGESV
jgi:ABC-type multidrug transport system fused ATPase/permease subunit